MRRQSMTCALRRMSAGRARSVVTIGLTSQQAAHDLADQFPVGLPLDLGHERRHHRPHLLGRGGVQRSDHAAGDNLDLCFAHLARQVALQDGQFHQLGAGARGVAQPLILGGGVPAAFGLLLHDGQHLVCAEFVLRAAGARLGQRGLDRAQREFGYFIALAHGLLQIGVDAALQIIF
jgi:hypothetical protein